MPRLSYSSSSAYISPTFQAPRPSDDITIANHRERLWTSASSPMGHVFWRDFAYTNKRFRLRMATGSVGEAAARLFARLLSGQMIEIEVGTGEQKRRWHIHRELLIYQSELLEEEIGGKKNGDKIHLPDQDPAGFELFLKWLYQGKLDDVSDIPGQDRQYEYAVSCHKLYLLCERLGLEQLKNIAMDQYRKGLNLSELVPDPNEINDIYRQSPPGSPWRKLMIQIAARQIMDPQSDRDVSTYRECFEGNPDFAIELVKSIKEATGGVLLDDPTEGDNDCDYHDHQTEPNCHMREHRGLKQDTVPPSRPRIQQLRSQRSIRPTHLPSPPASPPSEAAAAAPPRSPPGRQEHGPSPDSQKTDEPSILHDGDLVSERDRDAAVQSEGKEGEGRDALGEQPSDAPRKPLPDAVPANGDAYGQETPSPRRAPRKIRRRSTSPHASK